ncbi:hypothetical protein MNBD_GAMMA12-3578 [hydrothermal vent metagenome]|uniref:Uncharacterized protein n=1 Tax=hydrothermal vent metagenome TaxID=652676 RepID=A0A3B0Z894_9ZZZZ
MNDYYYHRASPLEAGIFESDVALKDLSENKNKASQVYLAEPVHLKLLDDIDYQSLEDILFTPLPLIRNDVLDSLLSINLFQTQFLPVDIEQDERFSEDYFILYNYNMIPVKEAIVQTEKDSNTVNKNINWDNLERRPLEQRMLFYIENEPNITIVHQSVKNIFNEAEIEWDFTKFS